MQIRTLSEKECFAVLPRIGLGRLACAHEGQPYVIPIYLVYEHVFLYGFTTLGQKVEWMRANPKVCVEWDQVVCEYDWTTVVIFGQYEELPDSFECGPERQHAFSLLAGERLMWWETGVEASRVREPAEQPFTPVFFRIRIGQITGRRACS